MMWMRLPRRSLEARAAARAAKDWATADAVRDQLRDMGLMIEDTAAGQPHQAHRFLGRHPRLALQSSVGALRCPPSSFREIWGTLETDDRHLGRPTWHLYRWLLA